MKKSFIPKFTNILMEFSQSMLDFEKITVLNTAYVGKTSGGLWQGFTYQLPNYMHLLSLKDTKTSL